MIDQYFTSPKLARKIVDWAEIGRGCRVLEPSAGGGAFVRALPKNALVTAIELDPALVSKLRDERHPALTVIEQDFLQYRPSKDAHDLAVMNPPYAEGRDGKHVAHALQCAPRVICLVRGVFLFGMGRYNAVFRWSQLTRAAFLVRRPPFTGPADAGFGARSDFLVLELMRRESEEFDRWKATHDRDDRCDVEWWADAW